MRRWQLVARCLLYAVEIKVDAQHVENSINTSVNSSMPTNSIRKKLQTVPQGIELLRKECCFHEFFNLRLFNAFHIFSWNMKTQIDIISWAYDPIIIRRGKLFQTGTVCIFFYFFLFKLVHSTVTWIIVLIVSTSLLRFISY